MEFLADFMDHYIHIGESTVIQSLRRFVRAVVEVFGDEYLRTPNEHDTARLLSIGNRLYALAMEKLSYSMAGYAYEPFAGAHNHP